MVKNPRYSRGQNKTVEIKKKIIRCQGIRFSIKEGKKELGRAYLYLMTNGLHDRPFGLLEDVYVDENFRNQKLGTDLVKGIIAEAKKQKCYKLIATSRQFRPAVHRWYKKIGFKDYGKEFRIDFK